MGQRRHTGPVSLRAILLASLCKYYTLLQSIVFAFLPVFFTRDCGTAQKKDIRIGGTPDVYNNLLSI